MHIAQPRPVAILRQHRRSCAEDCPGVSSTKGLAARHVSTERDGYFANGLTSICSSNRGAFLRSGRVQAQEISVRILLRKPACPENPTDKFLLHPASKHSHSSLCLQGDCRHKEYGIELDPALLRIWRPELLHQSILTTRRIGVDAPEQQMPKSIISASSCPKLCRLVNTIADSLFQQIITIATL